MLQSFEKNVRFHIHLHWCFDWFLIIPDSDTNFVGIGHRWLRQYRFYEPANHQSFPVADSKMDEDDGTKSLTINLQPSTVNLQSSIINRSRQSHNKLCNNWIVVELFNVSLNHLIWRHLPKHINPYYFCDNHKYNKRNIIV